MVKQLVPVALLTTSQVLLLVGASTTLACCSSDEERAEAEKQARVQRLFDEHEKSITEYLKRVKELDRGGATYQASGAEEGVPGIQFQVTICKRRKLDAAMSKKERELERRLELEGVEIPSELKQDRERIEQAIKRLEELEYQTEGIDRAEYCRELLSHEPADSWYRESR